MKKILICFFTMTALILNFAMPAFADTKADIEKSKAEYKQLSEEIKNLDNKIANLDSEINGINQSINDNKSKMNSIEKEIDTTEGKIDETKKDIDKGQAILSERLRSAYKSGSYSISSYVTFLFQSKGLSDLIGRIEAIEKLINADNDTIKELKDNQSNLQNDITKLTNQKNEIVKLNEENSKNLKTVVSKQNELKESKAKFDSQKSQVEAVIQENESKLISYPINIIDSSSSSISDLQNAVQTLKQLLPQLSTSSVIDKANSYISKGNSLINKKNEAEKAPAQNNNSGTPGKPSGGKKTMTMEATAYSGHTTTAMGLKPVRDPNGISTIAVDPNVIPLGSKVYVSGYGYAIASDTGGVIKGNIIDLFMNSEAECTQFGRQQVTVTIIAYPNEW